MTIRQMELFAQVYERRNLTRAAEALYMTQSAVTQNLKKMEEELGIQLFERVNRRLQPSPAGSASTCTRSGSWTSTKRRWPSLRAAASR